ncbi:hypothetical protein MMC16_000456 [Acarospora aff. strigata]|nr:hypothetical protein [Acarospora aff. strigata]
MEKNEVTQHATERSSMSESPSNPPKGRIGAKAKRHCQRFWWLHLIIFIVVLLVITLPLVFVGFPRIAQSNVNDSTLEIQSMIITDPRPQSFHLKQRSLIRSDSSYHPLLDAFNATLSIQDGGTARPPFATVELPAVHPAAETPVDLDQNVQVTDLGQYTNFAKVVLASEEYKLAVKGRTGLHQKGLRAITVGYDKVVTLKGTLPSAKTHNGCGSLALIACHSIVGLNGLKGFNVTSFQILLTASPDGANMIGKVYIPNPSVMTMEMGNVTMTLFVDSLQIGTSTIPDLTLRPGPNTVDMRATTNQSLVLQKLANYKDGILPVDIVGNSSVYNGRHLTYYEEALASNTLRVNLNVGRALGEIGLGGVVGGGGNSTA